MQLATIATAIEDGGWVYGALSPQIRAALENQLGPDDGKTPLCVLTAQRYQGLKPGQEWSRERASIGFASLIQESEDPLASCITPILPKPASLISFDAAAFASYREAFALIETTDQDTWNELSHGIDFLAMVDSGDFRSCSSPHVLGCIVLTTRARESGIGDLATSLVHELAHQELFLINLFDRLILPAADKQMHFAPYQGRSRPPIGRLHSLAALSRMIQFRTRANLDCAWLQEKLTQTAGSISNDVLTSFGCALRDAYLKGAEA